MNYTIADFLINVKNAYLARKREIEYPYSKIVFSIGKILQEEGYVKSVKEKDIDKKKKLSIQLLYKDRNPALKDVKIISKPSVRIYAGKNDIFKENFGMTVISTSKGIMTGNKAKKENIGGEVICKIF